MKTLCLLIALVLMKLTMMILMTTLINDKLNNMSEEPEGANKHRNATTANDNKNQAGTTDDDNDK